MSASIPHPNNAGGPSREKFHLAISMSLDRLTESIEAAEKLLGDVQLMPQGVGPSQPEVQVPLSLYEFLVKSEERVTILRQRLDECVNNLRSLLF